MRRILVAADGSESSNRAIDIAAELAARLNSDLCICHVAGNFSWETLEDLTRSTSDATFIGDAIEANTEGILKLACDRARTRGAKHIYPKRSWGDAAQRILEIICAEKIDTLVVGRRGRGRISGLLLGSVSQKMASLAPCVVIIAP